MEIPLKHDKKNNIKSFPAAINVGSGGLGIVSVVLLGGALVTATIVSAFAFRSRSQRRSSSDHTNKNMSQSTDTQSVGAPKKLELVMKTDTEFSMSEEVTSMKEIQTENSQSLTQDKKHDEQVHSGDINEDITDSVVAENQENTSVRVDSAFESEEQVVMAVQIEKDSCLERCDDGSEEKKHLMPTDNENDEHVDANSLVSDEGVVSIEEYEAVDVPLKDSVAEASKNNDEIEDDEDHQEVEDKLHDEITMENCEGDLSDETDQIAHEVVTEEETIDAARLVENEVQNRPRVQLLDGQDEVVLENCEGDLSNKKGPADQKQVMADHEVAPDAQEMQVNQNCETFVVACVMNRLKEAVDDQTAAKEDAPPSQLISKEEKGKETAQRVEELVTVDGESANVEMITEHELVKEDEIPHVESVKEDEGSEEDVMVKAELSSGVSSSSMQEEPTPEAKISNHKIEETFVQAKVEMTIDQELVKKDEIPHVESVKEDEDNEELVTIKAELSSGVSSPFVREEPTPETKISDYMIEENMDENQTILDKNHNNSEEDAIEKVELSSGVSSPSVQEELTPEAKLTNHKMEENMEENQTILGNKHDDSEEDVTEKADLSSGVGSSTMQEPTPETKIGNHKIEENTDENQTFLGKKHNDSNVNGVIKDQAFASEPWNLKLMVWSALVLVWCLFHWYSELPFLELSLVGSLLFILILLAYHNRATRLVKYE
ncbi:hypothetical protein HanRHA438_Chr11g0509601 [Helianthus annuus]|uniref:Transmembrane protein n=1 Tax=Helianthus annuus TaxID=4232 RepID=A0A251UX27_HELAN|nr:FK506-binding protein 5 [Helianthus annuus]KAF5782536.1 hypothetical protein HanXRQr2_Chr11g0496991 [Helianthus annuus]KAJ0502014.1 hypothetical protein HanHA300_Chr11g0407701 [Helianthus annuus]KAJ0509967.1 hypothetical protein HanIR_Chr11g0535121 [Helianthus annuus]KAJ0517938.1 hypothetical protein HanHA89_Chr11g0431401 [Helianthus annuus]KAJ0685958.1 hypothetical protein HanLR1_Chr11g0408941 [Helianthus annuus]